MCLGRCIFGNQQATSPEKKECQQQNRMLNQVVYKCQQLFSTSKKLTKNLVSLQSNGELPIQKPFLVVERNNKKSILVYFTSHDVFFKANGWSPKPSWKKNTHNFLGKNSFQQKLRLYHLKPSI